MQCFIVIGMSLNPISSAKFQMSDTTRKQYNVMVGHVICSIKLSLNPNSTIQCMTLETFTVCYGCLGISDSKYFWLGGLNKRDLFSLNSEGWKFKIKVLEGWRWEPLPLACHWPSNHVFTWSSLGITQHVSSQTWVKDTISLTDSVLCPLADQLPSLASFSFEMTPKYLAFTNNNRYEDCHI